MNSILFMKYFFAKANLELIQSAGKKVFEGIPKKMIHAYQSPRMSFLLETKKGCFFFLDVSSDYDLDNGAIELWL